MSQTVPAFALGSVLAFFVVGLHMGLAHDITRLQIIYFYFHRMTIRTTAMNLISGAMSTKSKVNIARQLSRSLLGIRSIFGQSDSVVRCNRNGLNWKLNINEGIDLSILLFGRFERATSRAFESLVKPGMTVLDIGANIGAHSLPLAKIVGSKGRVIAVEPTEYGYRRLCENLSLNPDLANTLKPMQVCLGSDESKRPKEFYASWDLSDKKDRHSLHLGQMCTTEGAQYITLDQLVRANGLETVDFIKMDVDGFESNIVQGGKEVFTRFHPPIIFELCPYALLENGSSLKDLLGTLQAYGYEFYDEMGKNSLGSDIGKIEARIPKDGSLNALALHKKRITN